MYDYHVALGVVGVAVGALRYGLYFRDIARGVVKPHVFSWFVWGLMNLVVFFAQLISNAGAGAWVTGFVGVACLSISVAALFKGEKEITRIDWFCFLAALCAIGLWILTSNPLFAVVIVTVADALGYVPTYRKSCWKPHEETAHGYALAALRSVFAIAALESFTLTNILYPVSLVVFDGGFALMLLIRRRQLGRVSGT